MESTESTQQVLKTDEAGRVWTPRAQRERILDEFERSGVSAAKFAAMVGVKYPTLANWIQKRRNARRESREVGAPAALNWVEATVECGQVSGALLVQLPGGATVTVSNAAQAAMAGQLLRSYSDGGSAC